MSSPETPYIFQREPDAALRRFAAAVVSTAGHGPVWGISKLGHFEWTPAYWTGEYTLPARLGFGVDDLLTARGPARVILDWFKATRETTPTESEMERYRSMDMTLRFLGGNNESREITVVPNPLYYSHRDPFAATPPGSPVPRGFADAAAQPFGN